MKKISLLIILILSITFSSCGSYAVTAAGDTVGYEYMYDNRPVFLDNGSYYWYVLIDNVWHYQPLPIEYWGFVYRRMEPPRQHFRRDVIRPNIAPRRMPDRMSPQPRRDSMRGTSKPSGVPNSQPRGGRR